MCSPVCLDEETKYFYCYRFLSILKFAGRIYLSIFKYMEQIDINPLDRIELIAKLKPSF